MSEPDDRPNKGRIKRSEDLQFYAVIVAPNGENLFTSETHPDKRDAKHALECVRDRELVIEE